MDEKWERMYRPHVAIRQFFKEPYIKAVAPTIAGAVDFTGKSEVKLLVIGGGEGRFSKDLLLEVKKLLKKKKRNVKITVVESDVADAIRNAPGHKVRADINALPFADESFDLIIGESMIHQGGPQAIPLAVSQIQRILTQKGAFIHIADFMPDPRDWVTEKISGQRSIFDSTKVTHNLTADNLDSYSAISKLAHLNVLGFLAKHYQAVGLLSMAAEIHADVRVNATLKRKIGDVDVSRFNSIKFENGIILHSNEKGITRGMKKLNYSGFLSLASKSSVVEINKKVGQFC